MVGQHLNKALSEQQRARWVQLITKSADDAGLPQDTEFRAAFVAYLEWGSRIAKENSTPGVTPPPEMPVPRWWWVCNAYPDARVSAIQPPTTTEEAPVSQPAPDEPVRFAAHIKPLFRDGDRRSMRFAFDLWSYDDVAAHADAILGRLQSGTMPCDGAWPADRVAVFSRWIESGKPACCAPLRDRDRTLMERKLATVLFADLVDSTQLLTSADPEVVRRRVTRYFERVSSRVELHGGVVEKFAGDAVMAAFGIPIAHEDDAERAARAALAIVDAVQGLGLEVRIGVEARGRFEPRGLGRELDAWCLLRPQQGLGRALRLTSPFIGREPELELLENTWSRALRDCRAHLVTIYGQPGMGKSRLAREFVADIGGATVLAGRCLPYGEAITFSPLAEMLKVAAGIADDDTADKAAAKLRTCCADDAVADLLGVACGFLEAFSGTRSDQEIAWAAHEWATSLANVQPLVLCFEDIHWAEEPLLDLISHLSERVRDVPLLIVCLSRPELLESRPSWGGGGLRSAAIELEPLAPRESERLLEALAGGDLATDERHAVLERAEGNPLFVEETVRMLQEGPSERMEGRIPETVQALIAARIDRLPPGGKAVVQRGAVIGRVFWAGAISALTDDETAMDAALDELVARELLSPEGGSSTSGERAYRFQHILIRDVAYASLSKDARAELHRRFADWLYQQGGAEELVEIRAHHLDRATTLVAELDGAVPLELVQEALELAQRLDRADLEAQATRTLAESYSTQLRYEEARALAAHALQLAEQSGSVHARALALAENGHLHLCLGDLNEAAVALEEARRLYVDMGASLDLGRTLLRLAEVALHRGEYTSGEELLRESIRVLKPIEDRGTLCESQRTLADVLTEQGRLAEAERVALEAMETVGPHDVSSQASTRTSLAFVRVAQGRDDEAEALMREAWARIEGTGYLD